MMADAMSDLWSSREVSRVADGGQPVREEDAVAAEEPLEIRVGGRSLTVLMRTPGHDIDLVTGLLRSEGIVTTAAQIATIAHCREATPDGGAGEFAANVIEARLSPGTTLDWSALARSFFSNSSCGLCGKTTIESVLRTIPPLPAEDSSGIPASLLTTLPGVLREGQAAFDRTGGLHACAAFDRGGRLLALREDVGRHNAVDKVLGALLLDGEDNAAILMVSGRAGFEIVQKAAAARVPVLCAVSAPSTLAVDLAREMNVTLVGFLRGRTFKVYAGVERIALTE